LHLIHTCVILRSTPIIPMRRDPMPKTLDHEIRQAELAEDHVPADCRDEDAR